MAVIKGRITVGEKVILSLNENPNSGGGTPAPIASLAQVNILGVASLWLKIGALDTDWSDVQTSSSSSNDWKFATALSGLNDATANSYFGTKSGDFDVLFARNNVVAFEMNNTTVRFYRKTSHDFGSNKRIDIIDDRISFHDNAGENFRISHDTLFDILTIQSFSGLARLNFFNDRVDILAEKNQTGITNSQGYISDNFTSHSMISYKRAVSYSNQTITNTESYQILSRPLDFVNSSLGLIRAKIKIAIKGEVDSNIGSVIVEKTVHILNNVIVEDQQDFFSQDANAKIGDLKVSISLADEVGEATNVRNYYVRLKTKKSGKQMLNTTVACYLVEEKYL